MEYTQNVSLNTVSLHAALPRTMLARSSQTQCKPGQQLRSIECCRGMQRSNRLKYACFVGHSVDGRAHNWDLGVYESFDRRLYYTWIRGSAVKFSWSTLLSYPFDLSPEYLNVPDGSHLHTSPFLFGVIYSLETGKRVLSSVK